jgi:hypothetical protein
VIDHLLTRRDVNAEQLVKTLAVLCVHVVKLQEPPDLDYELLSTPDASAAPRSRSSRCGISVQLLSVASPATRARVASRARSCPAAAGEPDCLRLSGVL